MAIILCSEPSILNAQLAEHAQRGLVALLTDGASALTAPLTAVNDELIIVDIHGPRLSRLNFDALALAIFDLQPTTLLSSGGRRLVEALGRLAEDDLAVAFIGPAVGLCGGLLEDSVTAGLNLIPGTVVIPAIQAVADLQALLARLSTQGVRLLALDAPVCLHYDQQADTVTVADATLDGDERKGSALMVAFRAIEDGETPTARLHALTIGMTRGWP